MQVPLSFGFRYLAPSLAAICFSCASALAEDWPQWLGPRRDSVWRETGITRQFPATGPAVKWRVPLGSGYSGPAVAAGRVVVMDRVRLPQATDPASAFERGNTPSRERVLCFNETDGQLLWQHAYDCPYTVSYPAGPRCTPTVSEGKVYTLGAEGHLFCLEATSGKVLWSRQFKRDFKAKTPLWGHAGHPMVDGRKLIVMPGGEQALAVALDKDTGQELWRALNAPEPGYAPPVITDASVARQLIVWHPQALNSLDPETGRLNWSETFEARTGLSVATPRQSGERLLVTSFYNGPLMMRLASDRPAATVLWRGTSGSETKTDKLHAIMCTPFLEGGYIYGVCSYGQLRCLRADTGERVWETFAATTGGKPVRWANAFLVKNGDVFFLPNEKGELIIARLNPKGYEELSRASLLAPSNRDCGRPVVWSHPAFANRSVYARNDAELVCASLTAEK